MTIRRCVGFALVFWPLGVIIVGAFALGGFGPGLFVIGMIGLAGVITISVGIGAELISKGGE